MHNNFTIKTPVIPIIDCNGAKVSEVKLPESITPSISRRGGYADNGVYYKGAGIIYRGHLTNEPGHNERVIKQSNLAYQKYTVINPDLVKKFGIFTFPHQPVFSDFEGGCGPKEAKIIDNCKSFEMSAISEIVDVIDTGIPEHKIYAYTLRDLTSKPLDSINLLEYILQNDFNSAWDKNLWADVAGFCYVRDIADWFKSGEFKHKLGTIYALLSSIFAVDKYLFTTITNATIGYTQYDSLYIPYISALIVRKFCPKALEGINIDLDTLNTDTYRLLLNELYSGVACCHLEMDSKWDWIRAEYKKGLETQVNLLSQELQLSKMRYLETI